MKKIIAIKGDGIGPEIMDSTLGVLKALSLPIEFIEANIGATVFEETGELIPQEVYDLIQEHGVALKSPVTTPIGHGFRSVNVQLRKYFDLYANIRPIKNYGNVPSKFEDVDLVTFRENTEDLYAGIEKQISDDEAHSIKVITRQGSERIARKAFDYAKTHQLDKVTVVTKANIMKLTDGMFLDVAREVAKDYPQVTLEERLVDNMAMQLVLAPENYQVILTENLYGDILSDLSSALIGGVGLAPGANVGKDVAIFEAVHGSAPDIAGENKANPTALILSASMMLNHLAFHDEAQLIRDAMDSYLQDKTHFTADLGGSASTTAFTEGFIKEMLTLKEGRDA